MQGHRPPLTADSFGPCFRARPIKLRRFDLGFVDTSHPSDARPSFVALDPFGPAVAAGLRPDDELLWLDYIPGDAEQHVRLQVQRGDTQVDIRYRPDGPALRSTQWRRLPDVPPESCVRP